MGQIIRLAAIIAVVLGLAGLSQAQRAPLDADRIAEIDALVETRMQALKVPGIALALIENGDVVHVRGFGVEGDNGVPVTPETKFQIGSISKPLLTLALLGLIEEGVLTLDDTIVSHIPTFQTKIAAQSDKLIVRHLAAHRSGLTTYFGNRNQGAAPAEDNSRAKLIDELRRTKLHAEPGASYQYSNANFQLLGVLMEQLTDQPLPEIFNQHVVQRYGLENTRLGPLDPETGTAVGHRYWFGAPREYRWTGAQVTWPQGGVETTVTDLGAVLTALIADFNRATPNPLLAEMIMPVEADAEADMYYGLGWVVQPKPDPMLVYHNGRNPGYEALAGFSPDGRFGFVVLANASTSFGARMSSLLGRASPI